MSNGDKAPRRHGSPIADNEDSWQSLQRLYSFTKTDSSVSKADKSPVSGINGIEDGLQLKAMSPSFMERLRTTNGIKIALDKYKDALPKLDNNLSMVSNLNGLTVHRALLQQQQLLAQRHMHQSKQHSEADKLVPELPAVPPGGQYMSVRRRTLQSNVPKPHQCQICGSRFTRFHNLKQHIKLHSGIKPYECDECGKRFTRNYTLRLHKMKHVGLRNFRCGSCDAAFTSLGEFRAHLRITRHSHLPIANTAASPHPGARPTEPEDLSSGQINGNPMKFSQFDCSMLNYGVGSPGSSGGRTGGEGSTGTLSPPGNPSQHMMLDVDSPQVSERSLNGSPQDLSTKRPLSDMDEEGSTKTDDVKRYRSDSETSLYKEELEKGSGVAGEPVPLLVEPSVTAEASN